MLTNKEIIQRVISTDKVHDNENTLTRRYVFNILSTTRSLILDQQIKKRFLLPVESYQLLPCIELEKMPLSECNCIPSSLLPHISVYRTKRKLPHIIKNTASDITTIDGLIRLDVSEYSNLKYYSYRKYGNKKPFVFFFNDYMWLINAEYELLQMRAVFSNPEEVYIFNTCGCDIPEDCSSYLDKDFPLPSSLSDTVITMCKQMLFPSQQLKQTRDENSNN